jgi:hypothetical protein
LPPRPVRASQPAPACGGHRVAPCVMSRKLPGRSGGGACVPERPAEFLVAAGNQRRPGATALVPPVTCGCASLHLVAACGPHSGDIRRRGPCRPAPAARRSRQASSGNAVLTHHP